MAASSAGSGAAPAGNEALPERQQVEQQFDHDHGVAADMAAIRQNLPLQLVDEGRSARPSRRSWPAMHRPACASPISASSRGYPSGALRQDGGEIRDLIFQAQHHGRDRAAARRRRGSAPHATSHEMMRRPTTSGAQAWAV